MKINKKTVSMVLLSLLACVIIFALGYKANIRNNKLKAVDNLFTEFFSDESKRTDVIMELSKYKKDKDKTVANKAVQTYQKINETSQDKELVYVVTKSLDNLSDKYRKKYLEDLSEVKTDSMCYDEAQKLIEKLNSNEKDSFKGVEGILITNYSENHHGGLQELKIKVKNTSGKDIKYLALDIFEIDTDGSVINSDWTNTDALILNDGNTVIDAYFKYQSSVSKLKFEIREVMYK